MTNADRQRAYRARQGDRVGTTGRPVTADCGTVTAYKRHLRHGEPTCAACRAAWAAWMRDNYQRSRLMSQTERLTDER